MTQWDDPTLQKVQELFDQRINPGLAGHGGWAEILELKDGKLFIRIGGGCQGCGMAQTTVKQGIESVVQQEIPDITQVIDATDHSAGANPYFTPGMDGEESF